ncbi:MAG TPA: DUF1643 domain-containing protein, partial [Isosphaeraceae bacterium]
WGAGPAPCDFLLLNPSTADERTDDPTVARCVRRARDWGFDALVVTNLFAFRATDPRALSAAEDPVGADNDATILAVARSASLVVCGWGVHGALRGRAAEVLRLLAEAGIPAFCLGWTLGGAPRHPLYLPYGLPPLPLPGDESPDRWSAPSRRPTESFLAVDGELRAGRTSLLPGTPATLPGRSHRPDRQGWVLRSTGPIEPMGAK